MNAYPQFFRFFSLALRESQKTFCPTDLSWIFNDLQLNLFHYDFRFANFLNISHDIRNLKKKPTTQHWKKKLHKFYQFSILIAVNCFAVFLLCYYDIFWYSADSGIILFNLLRSIKGELLLVFCCTVLYFVILSVDFVDQRQSFLYTYERSCDQLDWLLLLVWSLKCIWNKVMIFHLFSIFCLFTEIIYAYFTSFRYVQYFICR
jgi:hypothetical protein